MRALRGHRSGNVKRTEAAWAGGALVAAALAAGTWVAAPVAVAEDVGTTATVCQTVSMRLTNWSNTITLPKFDPALGTLQKAIITGTLKVEGAGKAESNDAAPSVIVANVAATGTLSVPGALPQTVNPKISQSFNASAYDGILDYAGTSGFSTGTVSTFQAFAPIELVGDAAASYVGPGTFDSTAAATGNSNASGPGNVQQIFNTSAQADVCVAYSYLIPPTTTTSTTIAPTTTIVQQLVPTTADTPGGLLPATGRTSRSIVWPATFLTLAGFAVLRLVRRRPAAG